MFSPFSNPTLSVGNNFVDRQAFLKWYTHWSQEPEWGKGRPNVAFWLNVWGWYGYSCKTNRAVEIPISRLFFQNVGNLRNNNTLFFYRKFLISNLNPLKKLKNIFNLTGFLLVLIKKKISLLNKPLSLSLSLKAELSLAHLIPSLFCAWVHGPFCYFYL